MEWNTLNFNSSEKLGWSEQSKQDEVNTHCYMVIGSEISNTTLFVDLYFTNAAPLWGGQKLYNQTKNEILRMTDCV